MLKKKYTHGICFIEINKRGTCHMKIVFVILHYLAEEETYKSVESIKSKIDTDDYMIVIVDNASPDKSGKRLEEKYSEDEKINVILNKKNLGFAQGNNVGFTYAKEKWNPNFIVLMNNDVYILDNNLVNKIEQEYERSCFAVLGPLIMTVDGRCNINPIRHTPASLETVRHDIKAYKLKALIYKLHLSWLRRLYNKLKCSSKEKSYKNYIDRCEYVQLHGAFLVFSKKYTDKFNGLDSRTFLYREEAILYKHLTENHMNSVYLPDIHVFHKEDASTDKMVRTSREKEWFEITHHLHSLQILLDIYKFYEKNNTREG